jgi:hypothetical protein
MFIRWLLLLFLFLSTSLFAQQLDPCPGHLLTVEPGGIVSAGSKEVLISAVRSGTPIRVGWSLDFNSDGKAELAHWADAIFLTEFEGEIFTQITEIQRQGPIRGKARIDLGDKPLHWTGLLGTNGTLEGRFDDDQPATQFPARIQWCIDPRVPREQWSSWIKDSTPDAETCGNSSWRLAYHHENDGRPIGGSKEILFNSVRSGYPIRFAWGTSVQKDESKISVEHAAEPVFMSIMNGKELVVQIPEHIGQTSYWDAAIAKFDKAEVLWRGMFSTTGKFDAVFVNRATGETVRRIPQRARIAWFVFSPPFECVQQNIPVLAVPEGVVLDKDS